jgi:spore maturation protein CgeB
MKFLIFDVYYPNFLQDFYRDHPENLALDFQSNRQNLFAQFFGSCDYYSQSLNELGHPAEDIIANDPVLQEKWAREHGIKVNHLFDQLKKIKYLGKIFNRLDQKLNLSSAYQIILAQIRFYQPDIFYSQDLTYFSPSFLRRVKKMVKLVVGQIASKLPADSYLKGYDLILSSLPNLVEYAKKLGIKGEYFKLAFSPEVLKHLHDSSEKYGIVHVGGYGRVHQRRKELLEYAAKFVKIDFWGYGQECLDPQGEIIKNYHGQLWGLARFQLFHNSKMVITNHEAISDGYANNMTLYEATGSGAMLLVDEKKNLGEIFAVGREVVVYRDEKDLVEKLKYYSIHEDERQQIAAAGQQRTLREHTYPARMEELVGILNKYLNI